jgi:hypothetical protein
VIEIAARLSWSASSRLDLRMRGVSLMTAALNDDDFSIIMSGISVTSFGNENPPGGRASVND